MSISGAHDRRRTGACPANSRESVLPAMRLMGSPWTPSGRLICSRREVRRGSRPNAGLRARRAYGRFGSDRRATLLDAEAAARLPRRKKDLEMLDTLREVLARRKRSDRG